MTAEMLREIEMNRKLVDFLLSEIHSGRDVIMHLSELLECCLRAVQNEKEDLDRDFWLSVSSKSKELCTEWLQKTNEPEFAQLYESFLLFEARNRVLDSYLLYLEKDRQDKDRFYLPRRKCFLKIGLIQALQDMLDDKLDILSISLPPGTGKTTLEKMFHSAVCGWFPNDYNLFWSHSADITRMYYDGVLDILLNDAEYNWHEIFPEHIVSNTNAKLEQINIDKYKPFPNVQTT